MVVEYGMSEKLGPQRFARADGEPFLGREHTRSTEHSDELAARIDEEIARLLDEAHARARRLLEEYRAVLDRLADALLERETLAEEDLVELLAGVGSSAPEMPTPALSTDAPPTSADDLSTHALTTHALPTHDVPATAPDPALGRPSAPRATEPRGTAP
jgi:cell division protease FtsH